MGQTTAGQRSSSWRYSISAAVAAFLYLASIPSALGAISVSATPGTVAPGGTLRANWSGLPSEVSSTDWIALYQAGSPDGNFLAWEYASGAQTGNVAFIAPTTGGTYEFRYFIAGSWTKAATSNTITVSGTGGAGPALTFTAAPTSITTGGTSTLTWNSPTATACIASGGWTGQKPNAGTAVVAPASFTQYALTCANASGNTSQTVAVAISGQPGFTLTVSPATMTPGGNVTVNWVTPAGQSSAADWIALYRVGDPDTYFQAWQYTGGSPTGTLTFIAPTTSGAYEFRYFLNGTWLLAATSNPASVPDGTAPTVAITAPASGASLVGMVQVAVTATDDLGVTQVQVLVDGAPAGAALTAAPYTLNWDTSTVANGAHTLTATAQDAGGNVTTSAPVDVTVNNTGLTISSLSATNITSSSARIVWQTSMPADTLVEYGTTTSYGNAAGSGVMDTVHMVDLTGLLPATTYHFRVRSSTGVGAPVVSADQTFTTNASGPGPGGYTLTATPVLVGAGGTVTMTWDAPGDPNQAMDVIGLYPVAETDIRLAINGHVTGGALSGSQSIQLPLAFGDYEFRYLRFDGVSAFTVRAVSPTVTVGDVTPPTAVVTAPAPGAVVTPTTTFRATASDNVGVTGVQFQLDGANIGAQDTAAPYELTWDLSAVTPGVHNVRAVARDAQGNLGTSTAIFFVMPDLINPAVSFTTPANGATVNLTVPITVSATDNVSITRVDISIDGTQVTSDTASPYGYSWNTLSASDGPHTITATAFDAWANSTSVTISVTVLNDGVPPTVSMTSPASGTVSGMVTVSANATDNIGVASVRLLLDGALLGPTLTAAPYSYVWDSNLVGDGAHTLSATAYDTAGNSATAAPVAIMVVNTVPAGLTASPATAAPGDTMTVSWTIPSSQVSSYDFVALYAVGTPHDSFLDWRWATGATTGSATMSAPAAGTYEFRYFSNGVFTLLATSNSFTVGSGGGGGGSVTLTAPATAAPGSTINVSWTGPAGHATSGDWLGLYALGSADGAFLAYQYATGSDSGSIGFTAPGTGGDYEFRYFRNQSWSKAGTSNTVTVSGGGGGGGGSLALTLSVPSTVSSGSTMTVNWTVTSGTALPTDWIGIYPPGADDASFVTWGYAGGGTSTTLNAPTSAGTYEVRYFENAGWNRIATSGTFTVGGGGGGGGGGGSYTVAATPTTVAPGGSVTVNWTASGGASGGDWVAVADVGSVEGYFIDYQYLGSGTSGSLTFTAPATPGSYEFRLYLNNSWTKAATSNAITVN